MQRHCTDTRLAKIDLTKESVHIEDISEIAERFLGGRGVNHFLLLQELRKGTAYDDPANVFLLGTGLLVGTGIPGANRTHVASLNALTGGLGSSSAGGSFAVELRRSGIDHVLITGRAQRPVYLWVHDGNVGLRRADALWGQDTRSTERLLREQLGDENIAVACIGPAGENMARVSTILFTGGRAAGRCGLGSVLGAKNVKAIAVKGTGRILVKGKGFKETVEEARQTVVASELLQSLEKFGTPLYGLVEGNPYRAIPARNFQRAEPSKRFHTEEFHQFQAGDRHCTDCPINCTHEYRVTQGRYSGTHVGKMDGNSVENFGLRLEIDDPAAVIKAHELCQLYGLDEDNTSGVIAWACECYERGLLTHKDTNGLEVTFGNEEVILELIEGIANREGFGDVLADGCKIASQRLGKGQEYCITVKGQELEEAIRPYKGWALGVIVSERGGGHTRGCPLTEFASVGQDPSVRVWSEEVSERLFAVPNAGETTSYENKARLVMYYERFHAVLDSVGVCYFMSNWMEPNLLSPEAVAHIVSSATSQEIPSSVLMQIGERIVVLGKLFNQVYGGFTRHDDYPPARLMEQPVEAGPYKGEKLARSDWEQMLTDYYSAHAWDMKGCVTEDTLAQLNLTDLRNLLENE